jgi:hypothetical protein
MQKLPQIPTDQSSFILPCYLIAIASLLGIDAIFLFSTLVTYSLESRDNKSLSEGKGDRESNLINLRNNVTQPLP